MATAQWTTSKGNKIEVAVNRTAGSNCWECHLWIDGQDKGDHMTMTYSHPKAPQIIATLDKVGLTAANIEAIRAIAPAAEQIVGPAPQKHAAGWCPKCKSYCYGDCH